MKKLVLALAFGLFFVTFSNAQESVAKAKETVEAVKQVAAYQCPMDCEKGKVYSKPGTCPVCKMDLKKVDVNKKMGTCSGTKKKGCCASKKGVSKSSCGSKTAKKSSCSSKATTKKACCSKGAKKSSCSGKEKKSCSSKK